jgi:hypothetical protein
MTADAPGLILSPFLSFNRALDFFGDGTLYLVDAPGHFEGHITALARVAPGTFVFLGADTCNNRECYTPGGAVGKRNASPRCGESQGDYREIENNECNDERGGGYFVA